MSDSEVVNDAMEAITSLKQLDIGNVGDGDKVRVREEEEGEEKENKEKDNDNSSGDCSELFLKSIKKKTNIYSTYPVPLNTPWTFWVDKTQRGVGVQEFEANLKRIYTFYTVHLFWTVYCNIPLPSALHNRCSLHLSRDERKPVWEEKYNCKGGTFRMRVHKRDTDKVWKELLMAAVGEQLNEYVSANDEVCGVSVSVREREDIILIWNTNAAEAQNARIFDCVRLLMPDTPFAAQFYKPHVTHHAFEKAQVKTTYPSASSEIINEGICPPGPSASRQSLYAALSSTKC
jgi:hypothetical protein